MPISITQGRVRTTTYNVKGSSLAEINEYIKRKGPRDPNESRRYSGSCLCTATLHANTVKFDFQTEAKGRAFESQIWITKGKLSYDCKITMPKLARSSLSDTAKREWTRFAGCVDTHEQGHVTSYGKEVKTIARELEAMKVTGSGRDENAAKKAAYANFAGELGRIDLADRLNRDAAKYDRKTGHGASQGAVLDTSIT